LDLEIEFHDNGHRGLYAVEVEGLRAKMTFVHDSESVIAADHTYVPPELEGRGIAMAIVRHAVEDARTKGWKIRPACSYVETAFKRHPEWADVLAK